MAMGWLKGLVAPATQPGMQQLQQPPGGPPIGGTPYGGGAPGGPPPYDASQLPGAMQWSTGTRTQGAAQGGGPGPAQGGLTTAAPTAPAGAGAGGSLEARCAQLQHDIESLALFARTLLTLLEESKVVTREQFEATKHRLDMLDGKLDDR